MNGIELQDREFFAAIKEKREPNASVAQMPAGDADAGHAREVAAVGTSRCSLRCGASIWLRYSTS